MKLKILALIISLSACVFAGEQAIQLTALAGFSKYKPADFSVKYSGEVKNPFWDAALTGQFTSPSGKKYSAEGFFSGEGIYTVRFCPAEAGNYTYTLIFRKDSFEQNFNGTFSVEDSDSRGFLRVSKDNCFRFVTDDNKVFYPLGIQTCGAWDMPRTFVTERSSEQITGEQYFELHSGGANLYRIQLGTGDSGGCALDLIAKGKKDEYNLDALKALDGLYEILRKKKFHSITILFQDMSRWGDPANSFGKSRDLSGYKNVKNQEAYGWAKKYMKYIVARYAAYSDVWEIYNEDDYAPDEWLSESAALIRGCDPYSHLLTTNFERPYLDWCDLVTPHEYMYSDELNVDLQLGRELARFKHFRKPVFYTEFGNQAVWGNMGRNKWRVAYWSAFFMEGGMLFWDETSYRHVSGQPDRPANAFLGPQEREDQKIFSSFVAEIPAGARPIVVYCAQESEVRGYGSTDGNNCWLYLNHISSHMHEIKGLDLTVETGPGKWEISWISTTTGKELSKDTFETNGRTVDIKVPAIRADLAAKITRK